MWQLELGSGLRAVRRAEPQRRKSTKFPGVGGVGAKATDASGKHTFFEAARQKAECVAKQIRTFMWQLAYCLLENI
jgi:hypothetical protein